MKKYMLSSAISALIGLMLSTSASAVTIDFTVFALGNTGSTTLVTPEATFNSFGGNFFVGAAGVDHEICALQDGFSCAQDFEAIFSALAGNLTLVTSGAQAGDVVDISAFDTGGTLLGTVQQSANGLVDLTAFSGIKRLLFDDSSTANGFGYDAFTFDVVAVPEPSTLLLLGSGLVGLGAWGWGRKRSKRITR